MSFPPQAIRSDWVRWDNYARWFRLAEKRNSSLRIMHRSRRLPCFLYGGVMRLFVLLSRFGVLLLHDLSAQLRAGLFRNELIKLAHVEILGAKCQRAAHVA